ncbi:MAG: PH domain-containing protein [Phycisphaerales bacterium]
MTNWLLKNHVDGQATPRQADSVPMPRSPGTRHRTKACPFCAETIRYQAIKCRFCGEFLTPEHRQAAAKDRADASGVEPEEQDSDTTENQPESDVLWFGRPSLLAVAGAAIKMLCFVAVCWAVYHYPVARIVSYIPKVNVPTERLMQIEGWIDLSALGLTVVAMMVLAWKIAVMKSIYYEVTPDRIEWSRGIFDRHVDNIDMFRVIDLKLRRSLLECILGIGTVVLITKDESDPEFEFVKVRQCRYLYDTLKEAGLKADKKRGVIHLE